MVLVAGGLFFGARALAGRGVREPGSYPRWARASAIVLIAANWAWLLVDGR